MDEPTALSFAAYAPSGGLVAERAPPSSHAPQQRRHEWMPGVFARLAITQHHQRKSEQRQHQNPILAPPFHSAEGPRRKNRQRGRLDHKQDFRRKECLPRGESRVETGMRTHDKAVSAGWGRRSAARNFSAPRLASRPRVTVHRGLIDSWSHQLPNLLPVPPPVPAGMGRAGVGVGCRSSARVG